MFVGRTGIVALILACVAFAAQGEPIVHIMMDGNFDDWATFASKSLYRAR